jgi:hypothetical protein
MQKWIETFVNFRIALRKLNIPLKTRYGITQIIQNLTCLWCCAYQTNVKYSICIWNVFQSE